MFKKLYLMGASPPRWPGAGPGLAQISKPNPKTLARIAFEGERKWALK
jgi:hypothetical protein